MIETEKKMSKPKKALGRGLSSLLSVDINGDSTANNIEKVVEYKPIEIETVNIVPNPFQPRVDFNQDEINSLASSIKKQGLIQPIAVRKISDNKYQIISGERRFRAFKLLDKPKIPVVIISDVDDTKMLEMALVENIQRENLNEIETALSYQKLLFECGLSHQELSEKIGKSRSAITNTLRLLKLPQSIQSLVRDKKITMGHARALLSFAGDEKRQEKVAQQIVNEGLSVRAVEKLSNPIKKRRDESSKATIPPHYNRLKDEWCKVSGFKVTIKGNKSGGGKVEINFATEEDLEKISSLFGNINNE